MKSLYITFGVLCLMCLNIGIVCDCPAAERSRYQYVPMGPNDTIEFEKGLYECLPVYVCGIYPDAKKITDSMKAKNLNPAHLVEIEKWIDFSLNPDLKPKKLDRNHWMGLKKIRWNVNYIVGKFPVDANNGSLYKDAVLEFQANRKGLGINIYSKSLFSADANGLKEDQIRNMIAKFLNIPSDKLSKTTIEKHFKTIATRDVCYGKIRCEWDETLDETRKWWSYLPFWYTKGKMFVNVTTLEEIPARHGLEWQLE